MKSNSFFIAALASLVFVSNVNASPDPPTEGKDIFITRCAACHNVNKTMTGPALAGVNERRSIEWIINFVHSSQTMIKKGDKDAVALYEKFNKVPMPDHQDLSEEHIKSIIEFIKAEAKPVVAEKAPFAKPGKKLPNYIPLSITRDYGFFISYLVAVCVLIGVLLFAVRVSNLNRR